MAVSQPRYSEEEFARRGDEIYKCDIRPHVEAGHEGKFVIIDIATRTGISQLRPQLRAVIPGVKT